MQDFYFNESNLIDGRLFIEGAMPGDFVIFNNLGELLLAAIIVGESGGLSGSYIDMNGYDFTDGDYKVRFISDDLETSVLYSSSQSGEWHAIYDSTIDRYMKISLDGTGAVWTPPISISPLNDEEEPPELIHNFIVSLNSGNATVDTIINEMVYPSMWMFCEIMIHYETAQKGSDGNFHYAYHNWNRAFVPQVFLNGSDTQLSSSLYTVNYEEGMIVPEWEVTSGDSLICTYNFNWFKDETLEGFVKKSIGTMNYRGNGQTTSYTIDTLPEAWYGISADLVQAMMCEHLILAQTMWYGKLIFAISANDLYSGGGSDIASNLENMKRNAEDRAYSSLDNEKMRAPNALARPTSAYWRAVTMGNGVRPGPHGQIGYGKQKGIKYNKMVGMTGPDLGI